MTALLLAVLLSQDPPPAAEEPAATPPTAEAPKEPAPEPSPWKAGLSGGLTWITGNVISISFIAGAEATRKTDKTIWTTKLFGAYGQKYGPLPEEVLIYNGGLTSQFDYRFTPTVSAFVGAGVDFDHVKSVELRGYGELGVGVTWLDRKFIVKEKEQPKLFLKTDLSARLQPEARFQYYPVPLQLDDTVAFGPRLALQLHWAITETAYFHEEAEALPSVISPTRLIFNTTTKIGFILVGGLAATITFNTKYDSSPAPGKKALDTLLGVGFEAAF